MNKNIAIITFSEKGNELAKTIQSEITDAEIFSSHEAEGVNKISTASVFLKEEFNNYKSIVFVGALGICVRTIAPLLKDKKTDPAVLSIDAMGQFVQSVVSGHIGGANELCKYIARITGALPVISTQSDVTGLWSLDVINKKYNWQIECANKAMNQVISLFVNNKKTALLLEARDKGTSFLESTKPEFVDLYYRADEIKDEDYELIIAVSPYIHSFTKPTLYYRPQMLHLGVGCRKNASAEGVFEFIKEDLKSKNISAICLKSVSTIDIKRDEDLVAVLARNINVQPEIYTADDLRGIEIPNPSQKVFEVTGTYGVAESCALKTSLNTAILVEKQKCKLSDGNDFTYSIALDKFSERKGFIEIVGAGPGDPELVSVRGKRFLQMADLILYAGSLVPEELTHYAKEGATVRSSAAMDLEDQFAIMKEFHDRGLFVVRLHTGDPCIYGAIQEQMSYFDEYGMDYHITPGISSFQAAAAELKSQFTIPEKIQSIILTRGEGRTAMPAKEKLHMLARSQSTMCIYLSASIVDKVQEDLMVHYPATTPVAACYKLTWKDQKIFRGELKDLAKIVKDNNLTLTTMIVVGDSIDNRKGLSRLYSHQFKHMFRDAKDK
jgi:precorrin-4 C11-methyltransferase